MRENAVLTITGPDRVGIVEDVTGRLLELGGNVEASRMARLGGEFAMLMLVSIPAEKAAALETSIERLAADGYKVTMAMTEPASHGAVAGATSAYQITVEGADHEGIVHDIAAQLATHGISIETMDTFVTPAAVSGVPLFTMIATVEAPTGPDESAWEDALRQAAAAANVNVIIWEV